jgi:chromosome segregation ATPase
MKKQVFICIILGYTLVIAQEAATVIRSQLSRAPRAQTESISGKIAAKQQELDSMIRSIPGAVPLINEWQKLDQQVKGLEDKAGVTQLLLEFAQYQEEACRFQRTNAKSREILRKIGDLNKEIRQITKTEQQKIDNLYEQIESADESQQKALGSQMKPYQQAIQSKSKQQVNAMKKLNTELRNLPELRKIMEEASVISEKIKKAVNSIKKQVLEINKKKQEIMNKLSQQVAQSELSEKIYDTQDAWGTLRRNLTKQDPCKQDTRRPTYLQYLN